MITAYLEFLLRQGYLCKWTREQYTVIVVSKGARVRQYLIERWEGIFDDE